MKQSNYIVIAVLLIFIGAGSFYGGMKYQQSKRPSRADFQTMRGMGQGVPGVHQQTGTEVVRGEIVSRDEENVIVKLPDESSKIVLISENTEINKATKGTADDLVVGEQIMVFGKKNSDESISAAQIQLDFKLGRGQ